MDDQDIPEKFDRIKKLKNKLTPEQICESEEAQRLLPFVKEIFSLEYEDKPNYDQLRLYLFNNLFDLNEIPTTEYDWNVGIPQIDNTRKVKGWAKPG